MKKIGLLSDTHSYWDNKFAFYFSDCDEIWHAGDIGNEKVLNQLQLLKTVRAVYGNIDGHLLRTICPKILRFRLEEVDVLLTHIGNYSDRYDFGFHNEFYSSSSKLFVCGHSHILKIMYDKHLQMLYVNPGASGRYGIHQVRTLLRFVIDGTEIKNMEIIELGRM